MTLPDVSLVHITPASFECVQLGADPIVSGHRQSRRPGGSRSLPKSDASVVQFISEPQIGPVPAAN